MLTYPHSAERIADAIYNAVDEYGIKNKVRCLLTDNPGNKKNVQRFMDIKWLFCEVHTVQLSVRALVEKEELGISLKNASSVV